MNNAKASNALLSMADAMASMAADYEQQIAGLKQANDAIRLANEHITDQRNQYRERLLQTDRVVGEVDALLSETLRNKGGRNINSLESMSLAPGDACRFLQEKLRRAPCLNATISNVGSNGTPPTSPTSEGDTPNG